MTIWQELGKITNFLSLCSSHQMLKILLSFGKHGRQYLPQSTLYRLSLIVCFIKVPEYLMVYTNIGGS